MNDTRDDFENKLHALRPRDVTPNLRGRIAKRLSRRKHLRRALFAGTTAAALAVLFLGIEFWPSHSNRPKPKPIHTTPDPARFAEEDEAVATLENPSPTLWEYRSAVIESNDALDALQVWPDVPREPQPSEPPLTVLGYRIHSDAF